MVLFTSTREKRLWIYASLVLGGLYSSLWWAYPLSITLRNEGVISLLFWAALLVIVLMIVSHGLLSKRSRQEWLLWMGIIIVYVLIMVRMSIPEERSHLIEYSVLAICIHRAVLERARHVTIKFPGAIAWTCTALLGTGDEILQLWVPKRVFDPIDILFNILAATLAIVFSVVLQWTRKRFN